jgi:hypothetical protein
MAGTISRDCLKTMGFAAGGGRARGEGAPAPRPNTVFICADDRPPSECNAHGGKVLSPHQERLTRDGLKGPAVRCAPGIRRKADAGQGHSRRALPMGEIAAPGEKEGADVR